MDEEVNSKESTEPHWPAATSCLGSSWKLRKSGDIWEWESLGNVGNKLCCGITCVMFPSRRRDPLCFMLYMQVVERHHLFWKFHWLNKPYILKWSIRVLEWLQSGQSVSHLGSKLSWCKAALVWEVIYFVLRCDCAQVSMPVVALLHTFQKICTLNPHLSFYPEICCIHNGLGSDWTRSDSLSFTEMHLSCIHFLVSYLLF